jgi:hypothetical protein
MVAHTAHSKQGGCPDPSGPGSTPYPAAGAGLLPPVGYPLRDDVNRSDSRSANATVTHMRSMC